MSITQQLVQQLGEAILPWPETSGATYVEGPRRCFRAAIGLGPGHKPADIEPLDAHSAIDEWTYTSDIELLSPTQRAVCGAAFLECLSAYRECSRVAPPLTHGIRLLVHGIGDFSADALGTASDACAAMLDNRTVISLAADEEALLKITHDALARLIASSSSRSLAFDNKLFEARVTNVLCDADAQERLEVREILIAFSIHRWVDAEFKAALVRTVDEDAPST